MKKISWEIILAGLLLTGISIYVVSNATSGNQNREQKADAIASGASSKIIKQKMVIGLEELEKLREFKELQNLDQLDELERAEKLKGLLSFIPNEIREDMQMDMDISFDETDDSNATFRIRMVDGNIIVEPITKADKDGFWVMDSPGIYAHRESFDASDLSAADIDLSFGSISVKGSDSSTGTIEVIASGDFNDPEELNRLIQTEFKTVGTKKMLHVRELTDSLNQINIQIETNISLPKVINLQTSTNAGHITLNGIQGTLTATTQGGHIKALNSGGSAVLYTAGGHISLMDSDITADLKTEGGNLWITNVTGPVTSSTNSGSILIRQKEITNNISTSTRAGTIELFIGADQSFEIALKGRGIETDSVFGFGNILFKGKLDKVVGTGGPLLKASSGYGNVFLKEYE